MRETPLELTKNVFQKFTRSTRAVKKYIYSIRDWVINSLPRICAVLLSADTELDVSSCLYIVAIDYLLRRRDTLGSLPENCYRCPYLSRT
jgi:hypothetical protein